MPEERARNALLYMHFNPVFAVFVICKKALKIMRLSAETDFQHRDLFSVPATTFENSPVRDLNSGRRKSELLKLQVDSSLMGYYAL